jgi:hypothetical protein
VRITPRRCVDYCIASGHEASAAWSFRLINFKDGSGLGREIVARKKRVKKFRAVEAVKALARERIGSPPPTQVVPNKRKPGKQEKHKPTLSGLLAEE